MKDIIIVGKKKILEKAIKKVKEFLKCDLCNYPITAETVKFHNGRKLCEQCYMGEVENPEHALPPI